MRYVLALLVFTPLLAAPAAEAQLIDAYGLRVGGNVSEIDSFFPGYSNLAGFQLAAFAEFRITDDLTLMPELEYGRRGYAIVGEGRNTPDNFVPYEATTRLDFISLPVLFRLHTPFSDRISAFALAGPRVDFLINRDAGTWDVGDGPQQDELAAELASAGAGITVGFGAALHQLVGREVRIDGRLNYGLTDWLQIDTSDNIFMRSLDLSVAIAL